MWPAVVLHTVANAVTAALATGGFSDVAGVQGATGVLFAPGNDGLLSSAVFTLVGLGLYVYRLRHAGPAAQPAAPVAAKVRA